MDKLSLPINFLTDLNAVGIIPDLSDGRLLFQISSLLLVSRVTFYDRDKAIIDDVFNQPIHEVNFDG